MRALGDGAADFAILLGEQVRPGRGGRLIRPIRGPDVARPNPLAEPDRAAYMPFNSGALDLFQSTTGNFNGPRARFFVPERPRPA